MSAHRRSAFPPQWEPPPRVGYGEKTPALLDVLEVMTHAPAADWVRQAYLSSFERVYLQAEDSPFFATDPQEWSRARRLLDALPEGKALHEKYEGRMRLNDHDAQQRTGSSTPRP
jgi:hypothetical protein